jgi:hypothetical protein
MERKLGNYELREFFRLIPNMGWYILQWSTKNTFYNHYGKGMGLMAFPQDSLVEPDDEQAYIIIDLTRRAEVTKNSILYYFHKSEYEIFDKPTALAWDYMYGMRFTFRPDIEDQILQLLGAGLL